MTKEEKLLIEMIEGQIDAARREQENMKYKICLSGQGVKAIVYTKYQSFQEELASYLYAHAAECEEALAAEYEEVQK